MSSSNWTQTELWRLLEEKKASAEPTRHYIRSRLHDVEKLLDKASTAPLNFALHDDDHSFRVAQRMAELIPDRALTNLSDFELGLLLQSAYLHDIGMNPRREIVRQIRDFLLSGDLGGLDKLEAEHLQRWLDEAHPGTQPPISSNLPTTERL